MWYTEEPNWGYDTWQASHGPAPDDSTNFVARDNTSARYAPPRNIVVAYKFLVLDPAGAGHLEEKARVDLFCRSDAFIAL
jgi:hypothetical protein